MSFAGRINNISDDGYARKAWFDIAIVVFVCLILIPSVFVVTKMVTEWDNVIATICSDKMPVILEAVWNSFSLASLVTVADIFVGLPIAWMMVRREFRGKRALDTILDLPLAFPTAVLGLSVITFWGAPGGVDIPGLGLHLSPYAMLVLLHFIFTYPYMVRSISAILEQIDSSYETAAMTLGASRLTAVRTITLPLFRAGLITGFILCFSRSLSETGGTLIALELMHVNESFFTGPTYIYMSDDADLSGSLILISVIMIAVALLLLIVVKQLVARFHIANEKVWPEMGRKLSRGNVPKVKNFFALLFLFVVILLPSFYIFTHLVDPPGSLNTIGLFSAIGMSFLIAGVAVVFDIIFGMPMALYVARNKDSRLFRVLDNLLNVPLLGRTPALGVSLAMFWGATQVSGPYAVLLVIVGHIAFTYPLVVRNIVGAVEEVDPSYEETAMTLGAKPSQAFRRILLPVIRPSIIAGGILALTRSLGETGATAVIAPEVKTVPCYIVDLVEQGAKEPLAAAAFYSQAAICSIILIAICFVFLIAVRVIVRKNDKYHERTFCNF